MIILTDEDIKQIDIFIKVITPIIGFIAILIGVWQFTKGQSQLKEKEIEQRKSELQKMNEQSSLDLLAKFKEIQYKLYNETTSVLGFLTVENDFSSDEYKQKLNRFWQLYWVELSSVESAEVESSMKQFGDVLKNIQQENFSNLREKKKDLEVAAYKVAQAIKKSARSKDLPS